MYPRSCQGALELGCGCGLASLALLSLDMEAKEGTSVFAWPGCCHARQAQPRSSSCNS